VDVHGHAELGAHRLREPDMVGVPVREDQRLDVAERAPEQREAAVELRAVRRRARVDDRDAPAVLDEVPVDEIGPEADDALGDRHRLRHAREHPGTITGGRTGCGLPSGPQG